MVGKDFKKAGEVIRKSIVIQGKIWRMVTEITHDNPGSDHFVALFIESVNAMFDNQTNRLTVATSDRIPSIIWIALFVLTMLSMFAVGYMFGKLEKPNWYMILALTLAFSAIILVIIDLDSIQGTIKISHQPMNLLYEKIKDL